MIHGRCKSRLYRIWQHMRDRCNNPNASNYKNYGARGIKICYEWNRSYDSFHAWALQNNYADDLSIDRINNNGDYCPENCRFTTSKMQNRNRRNNRIIEYKGKKMCIAELADCLKKPGSYLYLRLWRNNYKIPAEYKNQTKQLQFCFDPQADQIMLKF